MKSTNWIIKLTDKVTAPARAMEKAMGGTKRVADQLEASVARVERSGGGFGRTVRNIVASGAMLALTNQSVAFEKSVAMSNTIMKDTPEQFAGVTDQVRELSKVIPIARDQLSSGLYEVLSAGVPKDNAISFLESSAKSAVAGQADLGEVVRTTTSIIKAYGMEWNKQTDIQNRMQKAVDLGQMTMGEFASALPHATVLASQLGVSVDELMGAFSSMTGVTGNASEVSTQLASMMSGMIKPAEEAQKVIEQLGISFDANSIKKAGSFSNYLRELIPRIDALASRTGETKESIIAKLFGREEAVRGLLGLTGQLADTWVTNTAAMANSAGAVQGAFEIMSNTTASKAEMLRNSFMALWDKLFTAAAPVINSILEGLNWMFDGILKFSEAHPMLMTTIAVLGGVAVAIWAIKSATDWATGAMAAFSAASSGGFLVKLAANLVALGAAMFGISAPTWAATAATWGLNAALWANPIVWIIALIAAVIAAIVAMIYYWEDVKAWFAGLFEWFKDHNPFQWLFDLVEKVMPYIKAAWNKMWDDMYQAFKPVIDGLTWLYEKIKKLWELWRAMQYMAAANFMDSSGLPKNLDFRGYGVEPAVDESQLNGPFQKVLPDSGSTAPAVVPYSASSGTGGGSKAGMEASGGTKGAAIVNFKNDFKITVNGAESPVEMANQILAIITDQLSDSAIVASR